MTELRNRKNKHLTIEDRNEIQECLSQGMTFKAIGRRIGKDQTTVSKEIKKRITCQESGCWHVEEGGREKQPDPCPLLLKAPFVCNPCGKRHQCRKDKRLYSARNAQKEYEQLLVEAREGIPKNNEQFYESDPQLFYQGASPQG